ncbi:MAG TPA: hypothetical protein VHW01_14790 [Polyangiaceae bacterium]|nr:hypothetical protein [Polyangiaceae bacterium]
MSPDHIPGHVAAKIRTRATNSLSELTESLACLRQVACSIDHALDRLRPSSTAAELAQVSEAVGEQVAELAVFALNARASCAEFRAWTAALTIDRGAP